MHDDPNESRLVRAGLAAAMFLAPFLAFLYRVEAGLGLMAVALGATSFLLWEALGDVPARVRPRLRVLIGVNLTLALVCLGAAAWLLLRD